jgi:hypothetical protein
MDLTVTVAGTADEFRSLFSWLTGEDELRGRFRLAGSSVPSGVMGPLTESLVVTLGPGGVSTALATALVTWLRHRTSDVTIKTQAPDGRAIEVSAKRVHGMNSTQVHEFAAGLAGMLSEPGGAAGGGPGGTAGGGPGVGG